MFSASAIEPTISSARRDEGSTINAMQRAFLMFAVIFLFANPHAGADRARLPRNDIDVVRRLDEAYVRGWLKNDRSAVLSVFWGDAVIIPQGRDPIVGLRQIEDFWWPAGGGKTTILTFTNEINEIGGSGDVAFSRGIYRFSYEYESGGRVESRQNHGNYLMLFRRDRAGMWKISHRMWADLSRS